MNLRPEELELIGKWVQEGSGLRNDSVASRIEFLLLHILQKVATSPKWGDWEVLYRDPADGRLWERTFPEGHLQGGGPPRLKVLTEEEALLKYERIG